MDFLFPLHWFCPTPDNIKVGVFLFRLGSINSFYGKLGNWEPFLLFLNLFLSLYLTSLSLVLRSSLCLITKPLWGLGSAGIVHIPWWCQCDSLPLAHARTFSICSSSWSEGTRLGELLIMAGLEPKLGAGQGLLHGNTKIFQKSLLGWV